MKKLTYKERLTLPIEPTQPTDTKLFTRSGVQLSKGYCRIVIGGRGPYIEFSDDHILIDNLYIPYRERYRVGNDGVFYDEYRTIDDDYVKVYHQKNTVKYADYLVGFWYISPEDLYTEDKQVVLGPLYIEEPEEPEEPKPTTLFDVI